MLGTFDKNDNEIDLFVNGPSGRIATFSENDDAKLYYYLDDHINTTRVMMYASVKSATPNVAHSYDYHPFGQEFFNLSPKQEFTRLQSE